MDRFRNTRQPDRDWWERLWPDPDGVLRTLGVDAGESVADVGCGDGHFTLAAAALVAPAPVYAVDVDERLLEEVVERAAAAELSNVRPVAGDARELASLLPERVNVVLVANTFHGVEDQVGFVEQVRASLRPGGRLVVVNWHDRPREETAVAGEPRGPPRELRLTPEETRETAETAGFADAEVVELPPHHYAVVCER